MKDVRARESCRIVRVSSCPPNNTSWWATSPESRTPGEKRAVDRWARTERAMRTGKDLPGSHFPAVLAIVVALGALLLVVAIFLKAVR